MELRLRDRYPIGTLLARDPVVLVVEDFVSPSERDHLITQASGRLGAALVSAVGPPTTSPGRTGSVAWLGHDRTPIVAGLVRRMSRLVGLPLAHAESLQVVHYATGERYRPHFDAFELDTDKGRQRTAQGGQRLVTVLAYLNDVAAGGATVFPDLELEVEPRAGRAVVFHDVADPTLADLSRHPCSLHGGAPVTEGEKWACNLWFRERPCAPDGVSSHRWPPPTAASSPDAAEARRPQLPYAAPT